MPEARGLRKLAVVREINGRQDQNLGGRTNTLERGHGISIASEQTAFLQSALARGNRVE